MPSGPMRRLTPRSPRSRTISPSTLIVSTRSRSAPQHERFGIGSGRAVVPVWRGTARNGPVLETGAERMNQSREAKNKALVLEAFEILFNKRDYTAAEGFWSPDYVQHSAHIAPGPDGSCFSKVIPALQAEGHQVIAAQYGLNTTADDVATVRSTLARVSSPAILVGHSYGGSVITGAGTDDRVAGLVYIAALAPDAHETSQTQQSNFPKTDV